MSTKFHMNRSTTTSDTALLRICKKWIFSCVGQTVRDRDLTHMSKSVQNVFFINLTKFQKDRMTTTSDTTLYRFGKKIQQFPQILTNLKLPI